MVLLWVNISMMRLLTFLLWWEINTVLPSLLFTHVICEQHQTSPNIVNKTTDKRLSTKDHFIFQITPLSFLKRCISNCYYFKYTLYFPVKLNTLKKNPQRNKYKAQQFHFMICFEHCLVLHLRWHSAALWNCTIHSQPSLFATALCLSAVNTKPEHAQNSLQQFNNSKTFVTNTHIATKKIIGMLLFPDAHRKFHVTKCLFDDVHVCWWKGNQY